MFRSANHRFHTDIHLNPVIIIFSSHGHGCLTSIQVGPLVVERPRGIYLQDQISQDKAKQGEAL